MKYKNFIKEKFAVAGVIEALLLVALVVVILSTIQLIYVPQIMEQRESDHMDEVANQFSHLKSIIEIQSMMGVSGSQESLAFYPMSSPITLGSNRLPYFVSVAAHGKIDIFDQNKVENARISISNAPLADITIPLTSVKFYGYNYYFPKGSPGQEYILEGGGIILKQFDGEIMKVVPAITIEETPPNNLQFNYVIPIFSSFPGKNSTTGYKGDYIYTNYSSHSNYTDTNVAYIQIYTDYLDAWFESLIEDDNGILWNFINNNEISVEKKSDHIEIKPSGKNIDVKFTKIIIEIQTGPGFVLRG